VFTKSPSHISTVSQMNSVATSPISLRLILMWFTIYL
jgi:hypothetical protein